MSTAPVSYWMIAALFFLAFLLVLYQPTGSVSVEGFATATTNQILVPACVERSTEAQSLMARLGSFPVENDDAAELRLLVSKLCCYEADIASPSAGMMRTTTFQFRTSQDTEPASSFVGRCLRNAVNQRDIDIVLEKMSSRGHELIYKLLGDCADGTREFDAVVARVRWAMTTFCIMKQPNMDRPIGARDMGFWEPSNVSDLMEYKGISAAP
jgi:hypothetical protein